MARQLTARGVLDDRHAADRRRDRSQDRLQPPSLDHQPFQTLVHLGGALQDRVLLVDQPREGSLRDRDERHLVGDLEHGHAALFGLVQERLRQSLVLEARAQPEPGHVALGQPGKEAALPRGPLELDPGRQQ